MNKASLKMKARIANVEKQAGKKITDLDEKAKQKPASNQGKPGGQGTVKNTVLLTPDIKESLKNLESKGGFVGDLTEQSLKRYQNKKRGNKNLV